jgi:hypothetical protein
MACKHCAIGFRRRRPISEVAHGVGPSVSLRASNGLGVESTDQEYAREHTMRARAFVSSIASPILSHRQPHGIWTLPVYRDRRCGAGTRIAKTEFSERLKLKPSPIMAPPRSSRVFWSATRRRRARSLLRARANDVRTGKAFKKGRDFVSSRGSSGV